MFSLFHCIAVLAVCHHHVGSAVGAAAPQVTSISPMSCPPGNTTCTVTVLGSNFDDTAVVTFSDSSIHIKATASLTTSTSLVVHFANSAKYEGHSVTTKVTVGSKQSTCTASNCTLRITSPPVAVAGILNPLPIDGVNLVSVTTLLSTASTMNALNGTTFYLTSASSPSTFDDVVVTTLSVHGKYVYGTVDVTLRADTTLSWQPYFVKIVYLDSATSTTQSITYHAKGYFVPNIVYVEVNTSQCVPSGCTVSITGYGLPACNATHLNLTNVVTGLTSKATVLSVTTCTGSATVVSISAPSSGGTFHVQLISSATTHTSQCHDAHSSCRILVQSSQWGSTSVTQSESPIVGILTSPISSGECGNLTYTAVAPKATGCILSFYMSWLALGGMRVVPIPFDANQTVLDYLFSSVNVIFFTGGTESLLSEGPYYNNAQYLYNKAVAEFATNPTNSIAMWGTCEGFQALGSLAAEVPMAEIYAKVIHCGFVGVEGITLPLTLTPQAKTSRLFGNASSAVWYDLTSTNSTTNVHQCGIQPAVFQNASSGLPKTFTVLSTNVDAAGVEFVSTMEGSQMPFFGTQWHPERAIFALSPLVSNNANAIRVSEYVVSVLAQYAKKSFHAFPTPAAARDALLALYPSLCCYDAGNAYYI